MSKVKYEVVAVTGKYTDRDGNEKNRYLKCGVVIQTDKGFSLKLEAVPVESNGWFMLFEPKERGESKGNTPLPAPSGDFDDDIPFMWAAILPLVPFLGAVSDAGKAVLQV